MTLPSYMQTASPARAPNRVWLAITLAALALAMLAGATMLVRAWLPVAAVAGPGKAGWSTAQQREYATKLMSEGLHERAAREFDRYLRQPEVSSQDIAAVSFTIGKLYFDAARYEDALAALYRVALADAAAPQREQAARVIVTCLERLGRSLDAKDVLDQETALRQPAGRTNARATVLASIGDATITVGDLRALIQDMPAAEQRRYATTAAKRELLEQLVNQRLLAMKARALGLDATPEIRKHVERVEDQLLVQRYLTHELAKSAPVAAGDVKLFYEAHPELFSAPARAQVTVLLSPTRAAAQKDLEAVLAGAAPAQAFTALVARTASASNVVTLVVDARGDAGAFGHEPALAAAALAQPAGLLTNVVATAQGHAVVNVTRHEPGARQPFAAVQSHAERYYQDYRQQSLLQSVLSDLQHTYRVQLFDERLDDAAAAAAPASSPAASK